MRTKIREIWGGGGGGCGGKHINVYVYFGFFM